MEKLKNLKINIYLKIGIIFIVALFLLSSTSLITDLVRERESLQYSAIREVSQKWGNAQTISGPFISIPYYRYETEVRANKSVKILKYKEHIHLLPENLEIKGNINPEKKHRGIYDIVVYGSDLQISGEFKNLNYEDLNINPKDILWDKAVLTTGISDLRGVQNQVLLNWEDKELLFSPGTTTSDLVNSGINAKLNFRNKKDTSSHNFSFNLSLKGSQLLYFTPLGKTTNVNIISSWNNPKFSGAYITDSNKVDEKGFTANWKILNLNRNYPQVWINNKYNISQSAFGVDLILPVDSYQKITRSVKYAILFIGLTFLVFFFVEILKKRFIHPIQYILVGISLVVFYSLLLSISEQLNFNLAFGISATATLLLIFSYVKAILKSWSLTFLITGILAVLYTFIFVIIQMQEMSLLIGSIGIFIILALVMFFSRKIDWYNIKFEKKEKNIDKNDVLDIDAK